MTIGSIVLLGLSHAAGQMPRQVLGRRRRHQYAKLSPILIVAELALGLLDHGRGQSPCFGLDHILIEQSWIFGVKAARLDLLYDEGMKMAD
jgi:hypothetical protein